MLLSVSLYTQICRVLRQRSSVAAESERFPAHAQLRPSAAAYHLRSNAFAPWAVCRFFGTADSTRTIIDDVYATPSPAMRSPVSSGNPNAMFAF